MFRSYYLLLLFIFLGILCQNGYVHGVVKSNNHPPLRHHQNSSHQKNPSNLNLIPSLFWSSGEEVLSTDSDNSWYIPSYECPAYISCNPNSAAVGTVFNYFNVLFSGFFIALYFV